MPEEKNWKPMILHIEDSAGGTSVSIPTPYEEYGGADDVRAVEFMAEFGALLDRLGVPNEKMYRRRLPRSSERIVDRISVSFSFPSLSDGT